MVSRLRGRASGSGGLLAGLAGLALLAAGGCGGERPSAPPAAPPAASLAPVPDAGGGLPNVLLVTLDTTCAGRLGSYGHPRARTPVLDRLAASGVGCEPALAEAPLTLVSHVSLLTGVNPPGHGVRVNGGAALGPELPVLAESFAARGYRTGAFVAAWVLDARFGLGRGFQHYDDDLGAWSSSSGAGAERPGDAVCDAALAWLEREPSQPFFAWVHFFDPHHPYHPPPAVRGRTGDPYDDEIAFADRQLGRLLDWLASRGLRSRTLVVAAGDHGEAFGEHGEVQHGLFVYQATLRVPLIFCWPGRLEAGRTTAAGARLIDVMPTILDLMGWEVPAGVEGRSLAPSFSAGTAETEPPPAYGENEYPRQGFGWAGLRCLTRRDWKYIDAPRPELYDLAADPGELADLAGSRPELATEMAAELAAVAERSAARRPQAAAATPELDDEARERLASLGYVAAGGRRPESAGGGPARDPKDMLPAYLGLMEGRALFQDGNPGRAVELLEPLARLSPESDELHGALGEAYLALGRHEEARREFAASLQAIPGDPVKLCGLGDALLRLGRREEAEAAYRKALESAPRFGQAHNRLGRMFAEAGDYERARQHFQQYVDLAPRSANARGNLGSALLALRRPADAERQLETALALDPRNELAHRNLGVARVQSGRPREAIEALRAARVMLPQDASLMLELAWLLAVVAPEGAASGEEAMLLARQAGAAGQPPARCLDVLAAAQARAGDPAAAAETARQALERAEREGPAGLAAQIRERLALYESGQAYPPAMGRP